MTQKPRRPPLEIVRPEETPWERERQTFLEAFKGHDLWFDYAQATVEEFKRGGGSKEWEAAGGRIAEAKKLRFSLLEDNAPTKVAYQERQDNAAAQSKYSTADKLAVKAGLSKELNSFYETEEGNDVIYALQGITEEQINDNRKRWRAEEEAEEKEAKEYEAELDRKLQAAKGNQELIDSILGDGTEDCEGRCGWWWCCSPPDQASSRADIWSDLSRALDLLGKAGVDPRSVEVALLAAQTKCVIEIVNSVDGLERLLAALEGIDLSEPSRRKKSAKRTSKRAEVVRQEYAATIERELSLARAWSLRSKTGKGNRPDAEMEVAFGVARQYGWVKQKTDRSTDGSLEGSDIVAAILFLTGICRDETWKRLRDRVAQALRRRTSHDLQASALLIEVEAVVQIRIGQRISVPTK